MSCNNVSQAVLCIKEGFDSNGNKIYYAGLDVAFATSKDKDELAAYLAEHSNEIIDRIIQSQLNSI